MYLSLPVVPKKKEITVYSKYVDLRTAFGGDYGWVSWVTLAHIVIPPEFIPPPSSLGVITAMITRAGRRREARWSIGDAGWEEEEGSQKSDKRAQTNPLLIPLVFNIRREYIICCVVLATAAMVFELAASHMMQLCSFASWEELKGKRGGVSAHLTPLLQH